MSKKVAICNTWLRANNDILFHCDESPLTGQLRTRILPMSSLAELGDVTQVGTVALKTDDRIIKLTTSTLNPGQITEPSISRELVSLLKSHLQKSVRRGKIELAVKTAMHLLDLDAINILRRLPIVMVEDVMFLEQFNATMWLMMAYPFRGLTTDDREWLLGTVDRMARVTWEDALYEEAPDDWVPDPADPCVGAIAMRRAYGGMFGDIDLLRHVAWTWRKRYQERKPGFALNLQRLSSCTVPVKLGSVKPLLRSEFLLAAVDHHCTPITALLPKSITNPRQMIWDCSSSINYRMRLDFSHHDKPYWTSAQQSAILEAQERLLENMFPDEGIIVTSQTTPDTDKSVLVKPSKSK